jgi:hypothetical protein
MLFDLLILFGQINRSSLPDLLVLGALMLSCFRACAVS